MHESTLQNLSPSGCRPQNYASFLLSKQRSAKPAGLDPNAVGLPSALYDWQTAIVKWAVRKGRAAIFADCGL